MEVTEVPFVRHLGIAHRDKQHLQLSPDIHLTNHLGTLHAGALYTLAESQSALFLLQRFPDLAENAIPLLRNGGLTYKKPVLEGVWASAALSEEAEKRFLSRFMKQGRGSITVTVTLTNSDNGICAEGEFTWFVQRSDVTKSNPK